MGTSYLYNLSKLHAVFDVTPGSGLPAYTFAYDANGNMDTFDGSLMTTWSSYNKPVSITTASASYSFDYGPDRARYRKIHNGLTTHYVGNGFEAINSMGVGFDTHRHYIRANGRVVMIREDVNGTVQHRYVHTDHLGSVTALTELAANPVVERYSYDAWGLRRNPETWEPAAITSLEKRGYTGHEHLDDVGMIHMNGRVYSPSLGRMLSPDPVTFAPENGQAYNRYSYVLNNPLKYTDPSGFQPKKVVPIEPSNSPGPMEHMTVTGQGPSPNAGYFSGMSAAGLAFAGGGGSGGISPGSTVGDRLGHAGNPVAEDDKDNKDDELKPGECNETTCRAWLNKSNGFGVLSNLVNANGLFSSAALLNFISSDGQQWKGKNSKWNSMSWGGNQWTGARSEFLRRAGKIKAAGQGFFVLGTSLSLYEGVKAFSNGDSNGVLKSAVNIGMGAVATFGGSAGLAGGAIYFGGTLLLNNPSVSGAITDGMCSISGNC